MKNCLPWRDTTLEQRKMVRSFPLEEGVTTIPIPYPPELLGGKEVENLGADLSLERKERYGSRCF